ncbi:Piso0_002785 [Millerozyma farinosa CBS 7064]|uniref:Piso0_002785 protein n=1 Tax=Pichia sorbitophila (strain ATCC MYA-4447 / BCRC 22081 / CBS 7064 / NBRC 10061 / NRRL Y-12695) TaxID=559304 RepID=G8YDI1_PICSO|nr:Piso0_002785 [Millerozyma farinosa CBS 7064]
MLCNFNSTITIVFLKPMVTDSNSSGKKLSVAFVCLGNICRSPMAEAVFEHKVNELGYSSYFDRIDSFGTSGWHTGDSPDSRSAKTCRKYGVPVQHSAQQISQKDYNNFDYIIAMDESNLQDLVFNKPKNCKSRIALFGEWRTDPQFAKIVSDPYYGGINGFETNFRQLGHFSEEFLKREVGPLP